MVLPIEFQPTAQADRQSDRSTGRNLNGGGHAEKLLCGNAEVNARAVRWSRPTQGDDLPTPRTKATKGKSAMMFSVEARLGTVATQMSALSNPRFGSRLGQVAPARGRLCWAGHESLGQSYGRGDPIEPPCPE